MARQCNVDLREKGRAFGKGPATAEGYARKSYRRPVASLFASVAFMAGSFAALRMTSILSVGCLFDPRDLAIGNKGESR